MIGESLDILNENPHCLMVLQAYADSEAVGKGTAENSWRERLSQHVESEELEQTETWSAAHGLLIAYGLIDIELAGRSIGIHYRITGDGKRALAQAKGNIVSFEDAEIEDVYPEVDDSEEMAA